VTAISSAVSGRTEVLVPIADVGIADDAVSRPGQHGHLVVPLALAEALGLATPAA